jgi:hypothetical protein
MTRVRAHDTPCSGREMTGVGGRLARRQSSRQAITGPVQVPRPCQRQRQSGRLARLFQSRDPRSKEWFDASKLTRVEVLPGDEVHTGVGMVSNETTGSRGLWERSRPEWLELVIQLTRMKTTLQRS